MSIAAIYDIHGNLPALEAVLAEISRSDVSRVIVGGDVVPGPMPRETLHLLSRVSIPIDCIQGNGEVAVLAEMAGKKPAVPDAVRETIHWNAQQLSDDDRKRL